MESRLNELVPTIGAEQPGGSTPWLFSIWAAVTALWLAFAFAPVREGAEWLRSAQAICFGIQDNGLPTEWGWAVLVLAPLSMLAGLIAAYASDLRAWALGSRRSAGLAALLLAGVFIVEGAWITRKVLDAGEIFNALDAAPVEGPFPADYPRGFDPLPAFSLVDQHGQNVTAADLAGTPTVLSFIYASCPTVCPFLIRDTLQAVQPLAGTRAVFLTLDPWRDTPRSLPGIARRFGLAAESRLLSGEPAKVEVLLNRFGLGPLRDPLTGEILHPPLVLVLDRQGRIAYRFNRPSPGWLGTALQRLQKES